MNPYYELFLPFPILNHNVISCKNIFVYLFLVLIESHKGALSYIVIRDLFLGVLLHKRDERKWMMS